MRFLLVAQTLRNRSFMLHLKEEGHDVAILAPSFLQDPEIETLSIPQQAVDWKPDLTIFLEPGMGELARTFESMKMKVFNGGVYHDYLHKDPDYANVLASRVKVPVMPLDNGGTHLQLAGMYNGKSFVGPALSYSLDRGIMRRKTTGPVEACTIHAISSKSKTVRETFLKLEKLFATIKFCGIIFIDVQLEPKTLSPHIHKMSVEIPDGFLPAFLGGLRQDLSKLLLNVANGNINKYRFTKEVAGAVKVTLPPYPHTTLPDVAENERERLQSLLHSLSTGKQIASSGQMYWLDVEKHDDQYITTGPEIGFMQAVGSLQDLPYLTGHEISQLDTQDIFQYRTSMGTDLATSLANFEADRAI